MGSNESSRKQQQLPDDIQIADEETDRRSDIYRIWTDVRACIYRKNTRATLFVRQFADGVDSNETKQFFKNGLQTLKQLHHPSIVRYYSSRFDGTQLYCLITERVCALDVHIDTLHSIEMHSGLNDLLDAFVFLHEKANIYHNNLSASTVFIAIDDGGRWKLGSFECAQKADNNRHWMQSDFVKTVKVDRFVPPEDEQMMNNDAPAYARDSFAFGKLIDYLLPFMAKDGLTTEQTLIDLRCISDQLTSSNASQRPPLVAIRLADSSSAFRNDLVDIADFLQSMQLHSINEKEQFFRTLVNKLRKLPSAFVGRRLCRLLLSRCVLLESDASQYLLPFILLPKTSDDDDGLLPMTVFSKFVVPELVKIFCVHETSIRLAVLAHFKQYVSAFSSDLLERLIIPELRIGMKDTDDRIVSASMHCLADLVPLLGADIVTECIQRRKYFSDGKPKTLKSATSTLDALCSLTMPKTGDDRCATPENDANVVEHISLSPQCSMMPVDDDRISDDADWTEWDKPNNTEQVVLQLIPTTSPITINYAPTSSHVVKKPAPTLGSEYDIQALDIRIDPNADSIDVDYFADMQPTIIAGGGDGKTSADKSNDRFAMKEPGGANGGWNEGWDSD